MKIAEKIYKHCSVPLVLIGSAFLLTGCTDANLIERVSSPFSYGFFGFILLFLCVSAVIDLMNSRRAAADKVLWILVVVFFPIAGYIIYRLFGHSTTKRYSK